MIALDQTAYCIIGTLFSFVNHKIKIYADMTISAQAYRLSKKGLWYGKILESVVNCICFNKDHCETAYYAEQQRRQLPSDLQKEEAE